MSYNYYSDGDEDNSDGDEDNSDEDKLDSDEDKLDPDEDKLVSDEDKLDSDDDKLDSDDDKLDSDEDKLDSDEDKLRIDGDKLENDKDKLIPDKDKLIPDKDKLISDKDKIIIEDKLKIDEKLINKEKLLSEENDNEEELGMYQQKKEIKEISILNNYNFPDDIKSKAMEYWSDIPKKIKKGKNKKEKKLLFNCIERAYIDLSQAIHPMIIIKELGLVKHDINSSRSLYRSGNERTTLFPSEYIYSQLKSIGIVDIDIINDIKEGCDNLIKNNPELLDENPIIIASGYIIFFLNNRGYKLKDKKSIIEKLRVSELTLNKVSKNIESNNYNN